MRTITAVTALCLTLVRSVHAETVRTLADCIELALRHHPALQASSARVRAAQQRIRQAAAPFLPHVDATYSANRRNTSVAARTGTTLGTATQTFNFFNTGVSFSQLLFDFGQTLHAIRAAQANADAAAADLASQREQVIFGVKQAYFALLTAQQLHQVAEEAVRQSEKHLELAEGRYAVGLAPKLDVTRERAQLSANRLNLVQAKNNVLLGRETLRTAMGLDEPVGFSLAELRYVPLAAADEKALVEKAWDLRPELASLRAQLRGAEQQVAVLERNHLPFVTAGGQYQWSGADFPLQSNWNIGAAVTLPLFRGGLTVAQVVEAKENLAALTYQEKQLRQSVALEVRQALLRLREAEQSIVVAREGLEQAQESLRLAEGRYATGVGSMIEVVDAQATFVSARGRQVQASYDYHTAVAALEKAVGTVLAPTGSPLASSEE